MTKCDCNAPQMQTTTHEDTCGIYATPKPAPPAVVAECWTCWPAGMVIRDTNITSHRAAGHDVREVKR